MACGYVDDFCLSRVGRIASLSFLDLSECPKITANGLASLSHLRNLRYLSLDDNPLLEHRELVSLLLEDKLPHLYIQGVEYVGQLPADSLRRILALAPPNENPLSEDNRETGDSTLTLPTSKDEILSLNQGPPPTDSEARLPHKTKMDDNTGMDYRDLRKLVIE
ncbi:unnamed protein product [Protopolystoma xenopodis]|uniref:Mitochondrial ATP synthase regulatory component factor B n=1 Tax=Protopolystoma xenopodis TaxID=117903 RepID=A0A3S5BWQ5_9PLAT|nr:unnamed protein product [Protopolystoma xenopodis]